MDDQLVERVRPEYDNEAHEIIRLVLKSADNMASKDLREAVARRLSQIDITANAMGYGEAEQQQASKEFEASVRWAMDKTLRAKPGHQKPMDGQQWGAWRFRQSNLTLQYQPFPQYEVDLEDCRSSAQILDWIVQVAKKAWIGTENLADLITALDDLCDLQGRVCSCGEERMRGHNWAKSDYAEGKRDE